jgi:SAM-dependent methyltransferase
MPEETTSVAYWDRVAEESEFTFPVNYALLEEHLGSDATVVDVGCGYGRVTADLQSRGFTNILGFDPSPSMIERGRREHPDLDLRIWSGDELPLPADSADAVLMVGVLSCVLQDATRRELIDEVTRVLAPGGLLYISDAPIQSTPKYQERYTRELEEKFGHGALHIGDEGVVRHLSESAFRDLTTGFTTIHRARIGGESLSGNSLETIRFLGNH